MKRTICLAALIFFLQNFSYTQSDIRVELNAGLSLLSKLNTVLPYWDNGWKIGIGVLYVVSQNVQLSANAGYNRFGYSGQGPTLATPRIVGFRREMTGEKSNIYEISLGTRLFISRGFVQPFISIRGGIQSTQVGEIRIMEWMEQNPQNTLTHYVYKSSGINFSKPFASIGFGVDVPINSSFNLLLEGIFARSFDGAQLYYPVFASLQYEP